MNDLAGDVAARSEKAPARLRAAPALPAFAVVEESIFRRAAFGVLMLAVLILYASALSLYWYPGHPGTDQNGYLVGGKLLAFTGSTGFKPANVYEFVGNMWNLGPDGKTFYPKYPLGLPAIYAVCVKIFGVTRGAWWAYVASPAGAVLALWATYLLARPLVGGFGAILAALVVGTSPITMGLATNPNSHATTLACTTLGMAMLFSWWRRGGWWRGVIAGFFCGYALTIRYTEGLLLLPMAFVFIDRWFRRERGAYWQGLMMFASWAVPVGALLAFNVSHFGTPTGYDSTRESMGFSWASFVANWDLMLREMNDKGLALIFPLGLAGMGLMAAAGGAGGRGMWKVGTVLALWAIPCLLTYTAYYWAPDGQTIGYSRFFLTVLPAVAVAGVWVLVRVGELLAGKVSGGSVTTVVSGIVFERAQASRRWWGSAIVAGGVVALATATSAQSNAESTIPDSRMNMMVALGADHVQRAVPAGSVIFSEQRMMNHLQFVGDYQLYTGDVFSRATVQRLGQQADVDDPNPMQPQRASALYAKLKNKAEGDLIAEQNIIMDDALKAGRRVFFVAPLNQVEGLRRRFLPVLKYESKVVDRWQEPAEFRRNRWQRTNAAPPTWMGRRREPVVADRGQMWQVVEVTRKVSVPATQGAAALSPAQQRAAKAAARREAQRDALTGNGAARPRPATMPASTPATQPGK